jgi:hypothetical protein
VWRSFGGVSVDSPEVGGWLAANRTLRPIALLGLSHPGFSAHFVSCVTLSGRH